MSQTERQLQRQVATYFATVLPKDVLAFHIPNEGKRGWHAQADFKFGGGLPGVADWYLSWFLYASPGIHRTGWIELKSATGKLTDEQELFRYRVQRIGHLWALCRSFDAVTATLSFWGVPMRSHAMIRKGRAA